MSSYQDHQVARSCGILLEYILLNLRTVDNFLQPQSGHGPEGTTFSTCLSKLFLPRAVSSLSPLQTLPLQPSLMPVAFPSIRFSCLHTLYLDRSHLLPWLCGRKSVLSWKTMHCLLHELPCYLILILWELFYNFASCR